MKTNERTFLEMPHTSAGRWALALLALFCLLFLIDVFALAPASDNAIWRQAVMPFYAIFMLLCGLGAGVAGLLSLVRAHERSWVDWLAVLAGLLSLTLLVVELFFPH